MNSCYCYYLILLEACKGSDPVYSLPKVTVFHSFLIHFSNCPVAKSVL